MLVGTSLPETSETELRNKIARRFPAVAEAPPPASIALHRDFIVRLLSGEKLAPDLAGLDLGEIPAFDRQVYAAAASIPPGSTCTYGELAAAIGAPGAARPVGAALGRNPFPIIVPCHRILSAKGSGGFSAPGGVDTKMKLLAIEQAGRGGEPGLFAHLPLAVAPQRSF